MSIAAPERVYSPADLLLLPNNGKGFELVAGSLVEKNVGALASWVAGRILFFLTVFGQDPGLGWVLGSEAGYQCFPDDRLKVRKPDVSFIRRGRLPDERIPTGHVAIPPDLVVEVVSPNDRFYEVDAKVSEYIAAGVPLVWVVNPESRTVQVTHADGSSVRLVEMDELTAAGLLPELRVPVVDLFSPPSA